MTGIVEIILWLSLGLVAYAYVGYPVVVWVCSRAFGAKPLPPANPEPPLTVTVLISALNEQDVIAERLENLLQQDYPAEPMEVVIASDGSIDRTAEIVRDFEQRFPGRIRLMDYPERRGKANVLNATLPNLTGEIVVLSDANTNFDKSAITNLARWFTRPDVAVVCGKLQLVDPATGKNADSLYWKYENLLKECEGRLSALLGANGAIYAIRKSDYVPIAGDTIIDDFMIPLLARLRHRKRIVYDVDALATEETPPNVGDEFRRRSRIGAGGFQSIARLWPLLFPTQGWTCFTYWSHKVLRWLCPAFLVLALITNVWLAIEGRLIWLLVAQSAFYAAAAIGSFVSGNRLPAKLLRLSTLFTSMNLALAVGFWRWLAGKQRGTWQRTAR